MRFVIILLFTLSFSTFSSAAIAPAAGTPVTETFTSTDLSRATVEARLGRKLNFKERLGLSVARGKAKRAERRAAREGRPVSGLALGSFGAALASIGVIFAGGGAVAGLLFLLLVPTALVLGIVALTQWKKHPERTGKGFAIAGIVISGLWILLFGAALAIAAAL